MKWVERMNVVVVWNPLHDQGGRGGRMRRDSYMMDVDRGRNCYCCGNFGHLAKNYRNQGIIRWGKRLEYGDNQNNKQQNNLNRDGNLIVFD